MGVSGGPGFAGGGARHDQAAVAGDAASATVVVAAAAQEGAVEDSVEVGAELHNDGVVGMSFDLVCRPT